MDFSDLQLDNRTAFDISLEAAERLKAASEGRITDFSVGTPQTALLTTQAWIQSLFAEYINSMPQKIINKWLEIMGIQQSTGRYASVILTIEVIPTNYEIRLIHPQFFLAGELMFSTISDIVIASNSTAIQVPLKAIEKGVSGNVAPYSIQTMINPSSAITALYNQQQASGGEETESDTIYELRFAAKLYRRGLLRTEDIALEVRDLLGRNALVSVKTGINSQQQREELAILVAATDSNQKPITPGVCATVAAYLRDRCPVFFKTYCVSIDYLPCYAVFNVRGGADKSEQLWQMVQDKINLEPGESLSIDYLKLFALQCFPVVDSVNLNCDKFALETSVYGSNNPYTGMIPITPVLEGDLQPPTEFTVVKLTGIIVNVYPLKANSTGVFQSYLRGSITGDVD